jgi:hypothetical protein
MDTVFAIQICSSSFTVDDICAAKKVMFESLGIVGTYVPHRRRDTGGKKTLEDIIDILRENEQVMPEFVHYSATADDLVQYIHEKTGYSLRVFQLRSRHYVHFSSFVVRVPRPLQETITCAGFWPMGVVFRRFRGNLPNSTPDLMAKRGHTVSSPK